MASTIIFDLSDEGVKEMVDGWEDNTEYEATVIVKTGAGPQRNVAEVTSFTPEETEETPDQDVEPAPVASGETSKPAGKIPAMKY
jgi:hypothetical protein